jgi:hypothetical protein
MLFCACPAITIRIMGAFNPPMQRYCGSERPPPGRGRVAQRTISKYIWDKVLEWSEEKRENSEYRVFKTQNTQMAVFLFCPLQVLVKEKGGTEGSRDTKAPPSKT